MREVEAELRARWSGRRRAGVAGRANSGEGARRSYVATAAAALQARERLRGRQEGWSAAPGYGWSGLEGSAAGRDGHRPSPPVCGRRVARAEASEVGTARGQGSGRRGVGLGRQSGS